MITSRVRALGRAMPARGAIGCVVLGSLATIAVAPATAAPAPSICARFNDDQRGVVEENLGDRHLDMLQGRLSSDRTHLNAVMVVALMRPTAEAADQLAQYTLSFDVGPIRAFVSAPGDPAAQASYGILLGGRPVTLGAAELVRDVKNREFRLRVPLSAFEPILKLSPGTRATALTASTLLEPAAPGVPAAARASTIVLDLADGRDTTYTFGDGPCVAAPKSKRS